MNSTPQTQERGGLPGFAVKRPVTMGMLFLSLLVVGVIAWHAISLELLPEGLDLPFLWLWIVYPNSSPVENHRLITIPVEESLWTIKGVKRVISRSSNNRSRFRIEFNQTADMDVAYMAVRDRLERIRPELPDDLRYIYIYRYSEADEPILYFGISITGNYDDPYRLVEEEVVRPIERVDGVATVEMWGGEPKMVRIEFILDRMKAFKVDIDDIMRELRSVDFAIAGGSVLDGGRQLLVRADGRIRSLEELAELPVNASGLHLKDIARISYSEPPRRWIQRIGGQEAIEIGVFKESDANTVELTDRLNQFLSEMSRNPLLAGLEFDILFDQGSYIRNSLSNLEEAGLWGALFAIMVLFLFLRRVRMTLFITLAIPLSLLITVTSIHFFGWSLNIITLSGLMICVGLVVDNAIVVVENIHTMKQQGLDARRAAVVGASQVGLPITLATLTTAVVFLPLILMSGDRILAFYMLRIGLPLIIALMASLMVALLFIPLWVHRFAMSGRARESRFVTRGEVMIEGAVGWVLSHRRDVLLVLGLLLVSLFLPMSKVVSTDEEEGHINDLQIRFYFPAYYSLSAADSTMSQLEDLLYTHADEYNLKTVVTGFRRRYGRMRVFLNPEPDRLWLVQGILRIGRKAGLFKSPHLSREQVIEDIKERFQPPPGVEMISTWSRGRGEKDAVYVSIFGEDADRLLHLSEDLKRRLDGLPGLISVETDLETSTDEVRIRFGRDLTARFGVEPAQAALGLSALVRGVDLPDIRLDGHEIEGRAELREEDRTTLSQVMNLPVTTDRGGIIRLDDIARVGYDRGLGEITRENRRTRLRLKLTTTEDNIKELSKNIDAALADLSLPPGYEWGKGGRFSSVVEASRERSQIWLLAIMFVFLLMGALFESFLLPWCVIITVPFSFIGVWWLLYLTGTQFGVMSAVGVIILIGVVVNNAIILVDRVNRLRNEGGLPRDQALALASRQRFRAIVMTAFTTIMGLMPMAVGDANLVGIPYAPMGRAIIGGMLTATITTPLVVPLAYSLIDDLHQWMKGYVSSFKK